MKTLLVQVVSVNLFKNRQLFSNRAVTGDSLQLHHVVTFLDVSRFLKYSVSFKHLTLDVTLDLWRSAVLDCFLVVYSFSTIRYFSSLLLLSSWLLQPSLTNMFWPLANLATGQWFRAHICLILLTCNDIQFLMNKSHPDLQPQVTWLQMSQTSSNSTSSCDTPCCRTVTIDLYRNIDHPVLVMWLNSQARLRSSNQSVVLSFSAWYISHCKHDMCSFFRANLQPNQSPHAPATLLATFFVHTSRISFFSPSIDPTSWVLACVHSVALPCVLWDTSPLQRFQHCFERHAPTSSPSFGTKSIPLMWVSPNVRSVLFALHSSWHVTNRHLLHPSTSWLSMHLQQVLCQLPTSSYRSAHQFWMFNSRSSPPSCRLQRIQRDGFASPKSFL